MRVKYHDSQSHDLTMLVQLMLIELPKKRGISWPLKISASIDVLNERATLCDTWSFGRLSTT